jgi:hypothetical protein
MRIELLSAEAPRISNPGRDHGLSRLATSFCQNDAHFEYGEMRIELLSAEAPRISNPSREHTLQGWRLLFVRMMLILNMEK